LGQIQVPSFSSSAREREGEATEPFDPATGRYVESDPVGLSNGWLAGSPSRTSVSTSSPLILIIDLQLCERLKQSFFREARRNNAARPVCYELMAHKMRGYLVWGHSRSTERVILSRHHIRKHNKRE
jgi:hypothetical protein